MTLRHLKIFVTVCECKGITAAAEKLFLAQPSVSLAIKELEDYYGTKFFDRMSKKIYLNERGEQFLNYAIHIVSLFDKMENECKNWDSIGILRVGSSITIGSYLLPDYVIQFNQQYPNIKVQAIIDNSKEIEKRILTNEIDFGMIEGITHYPHIKCEKFMEDKLILVCGKNHPLADKIMVDINILPEYDLILREKGSGGRELFDSIMLIHNIKIKPVWESVSNRAVIQAVSAGLGLAVLPYLLINQELKKGIIHEIRIKDISFKREFYLIYHENKYFTKSARYFLKLCQGNPIPA